MREELETPGVLHIDCDTCSHQHSDHCGGCLVSFLCEPEADSGVLIQLDEVRALRAFERAGMVPEIRHEVRHEMRNHPSTGRRVVQEQRRTTG